MEDTVALSACLDGHADLRNAVMRAKTPEDW